jgi:hypothetical protein
MDVAEKIMPQAGAPDREAMVAHEVATVTELNAMSAFPQPDLKETVHRAVLPSTRLR